MKAAMICDHSLDPRLRKRVQWLKNMGLDISIYTDSSRGKHFSSNDYIEQDLSSLDDNKVMDFDLIYISGAKIILQKFKFIYKASRKNVKLIYEIPDLPLRSHSKIRNFLTMSTFSFLVGILFKNIVITSNGFLKYLPKNKNYFLCENLPPETLIPETKNKTNTIKKTNEIINIGFVGALRYPKQMMMLIKFCTENKYNAKFYGGPEKNKNELIHICNNNNLDLSSNVTFYGSYHQNDLEKIYSNIDFVYSVYDAQQPNVRFALPNKLYESQLFLTPIIVASETYLSECVEELKVGFSVDSNDYELFTKNMKKGLSQIYSLNSSDVIDKINNSESDFIHWIRKI